MDDRLLEVRLLIGATVNRVHDHLGGSHGGWVDCGAAPGNLHRQSGEVHDRAVATVATQVVGRSHEDAINGARLHAERAKHALRVVNRKATDTKSLAVCNAFLTDVNTIDGTRFGALVAGDARGEIKPVKTPVPRSDGHRQFGILKVLCERPASLVVRACKNPQCHEHA